MNQMALFGDSYLTSNIKENLERVKERMLQCSKCPLSAKRTKVVFGHGNYDRPNVAFVGEGPGAEEDREGIPFIGASGTLLEKMLTSIEMKREHVYICNIVGCRPPGNRTPKPDEIAACSEYHRDQLQLVMPKTIVALGGTAARTLLDTNKPLKELRGKWLEWRGIPLRVSFHPAFLLRFPKEKGAAFDDLKAVVQHLKEQKR